MIEINCPAKQRIYDNLKNAEAQEPVTLIRGRKGRPKLGYKVVTMRVPEPLYSQIIKIIDEFKASMT